MQSRHRTPSIGYLMMARMTSTTPDVIQLNKSIVAPGVWAAGEDWMEWSES